MAGLWKAITGGAGAPAPSGALAGDDLLRLLAEFGYAPQPLRRADGSLHGCRIQAAVGDWTTTVHVFHGQQLNAISIMVTLRPIPDPDALPAAYYRRLLTANDLVAPAYYFYLQDLGSLFLVERFANQGISKAFLKQKLDDLLTLAHSYREHWDPA